jgi:hypothetical protein
MVQKGGDPAIGATADLPGLARTYLRHRNMVLFYTLLVTMVMAPILNTLNLSGALLESLLAACLLSAVLPVGAVRNRPYLLMAIVVVWLARLVTALLDQRALSEMALGVWTLIGLLAAVAALRFAIGARQIDAEHLYAALSAYLLAGVYIGLSYWVLEQMKPGTFSFPGDFSRNSAIYLLQLRDTGNARLWRHRAASGRGAQYRDRRRCRWSTLPCSSGRTTGQFVFEARKRIKLIAPPLAIKKSFCIFRRTCDVTVVLPSHRRGHSTSNSVRPG